MGSTQTDIYDELVQKPNQEGRSAFFQDTLRKEAELARLYARKESQATRTRSLTNPRFINLLEQIQGLPFWIEDRAEHKSIIQECKDLELERLVCCFNHCLGLPTKNGNPLPIFDYESRIIDALEDTDRIWIKKARGLGVTELIIRYIVWLCLRNNDLKGSICFIVTGPRQNIAMEHVQRIERLFEPFGIYSETRMGITELNDVFIQTIPSKNIGAMRGYDRVPLIFLDEADFFPIGQQQEARAVAEGYIPKTHPKLIMVSTPDRPDGLFAQMEREPDNGYRKMFMDYTVGLGKIYDPATIKQEMDKEYFEREYNLKYLGKLGNVFHIADIEAAMVPADTGEAADMIQASTSTYFGRSMGIDPAWGTDSQFAIVITQYRNNRVEVFHAENIQQPYFADVMDQIMRLKQKHHITKLYCDGANPEVIHELKRRIGEYERYELLDEEQIWAMRNGSWQIIPVNFQKRHVQMLNWTNELMQKRMIRIHPELQDLSISLRTARAVEGKLDKTETVFNDLLDAFRLSLVNYEAPRT
jgi:hypothetical protein